MSNPFGMKPSTRAFLDEARRTPGMTALDRLHGYVYARWSYLYIAVAKGEHPLSGWLYSLYQGLGKLASLRRTATSACSAWAEAYHGKAMPLDAARRLISVGREVRAELPEKVIPYAKARDIVLQNPEMIVALDCPCRAAATKPCLPLDVCLIVGEPFASFMLEHHPGRTRRIGVREAVDILAAEDARGHAHHAFFKDAMLGRFYAICNCCPCCCGAMKAHRNGVPMLASSGHVCRADAERCLGCGACVEACPFGALSLQEDGGGPVGVDEAKCMGCGVCLARCGQEALSLAREPSRGEPLEIETVLGKARPGPEAK